jgi:hypothetical protein
MSPLGRPKREYRRARPEGTPVSPRPAVPEPERPLTGAWARTGVQSMEADQ